MDIGEVWALAYRGAKNAGSPEPEDAAQTVILRFLERGRGRGYADVRKPSVYWGLAGKREAIRQWRKRTCYGQAVILISYEPWHTPAVDVEEEALNCLALASIPAWVKDIADRKGRGGRRCLEVTGAERIRLWRWKHSPLVRKALGYLREA